MILNPGYYSENDLKDVGFKMLGKNVSISKNSTFIGVENISIGNNVRIDGNVTFAVAAGHINLGNYIHIGGSSHINGSVEWIFLIFVLFLKELEFIQQVMTILVRVTLTQQSPFT